MSDNYELTLDECYENWLGQQPSVVDLAKLGMLPMREIFAAGFRAGYDKCEDDAGSYARMIEETPGLC